METIAVVLRQPEQLELDRLALTPPAADDVVVDVEWSGISTGTERLLWSGRMPPFPGMGYPLVPGYESVGRVGRSGRATPAAASASACSCPARTASARCAACSAVPPRGSSCPAQRVVPHRSRTSASAACCWRWPRRPITRSRRAARRAPDLHRRPRRARPAARALSIAARRRRRRRCGRRNPARAGGAVGYDVIDPEHDARRDYRAIYDVSGDAGAARHADRAPRAGRRDRARRLLQRAAVLRIPAGLHARGAAPRRRRVAAGRPRRGQGADRVRARCRSTA